MAFYASKMVQAETSSVCGCIKLLKWWKNVDENEFYVEANSNKGDNVEEVIEIPDEV